MKQRLFKRFSLMLTLILLVAAFTGCSRNTLPSGREESGVSSLTTGSSGSSQSTGSSLGAVPDSTEQLTQLTVRFGDEGAPFVMHLYDNDTAAAIAGYVGTTAWRLPIYHYDDYENFEVMQYYDIPSRYEIPSNAETVSEEKAGTVYYSEPNRIVLFFGDAEVSGEYTPVGYFDYSEDFLAAVQENPVLEGWGNKIINISSGD